jgi:DNA repair protein SbcC/Rad50
MFLSKLFKPKWQHKNPDIRKQALLGLTGQSAEDRAVWLHVAKHDHEPELRKLAIKHLIDPQLLGEIALTDTDHAVKDQAKQRLQRILAGQLDHPLTLEERLRLLADSNDTEVLEYIASYGRDVELRLAAVERITREALLGDIAIQDPEPRVRHIAIERVTQASTLERVFKQTRTKDKRVSRIAKERLTALEESAHRPVRIREEAESICTHIEDLAQSQNWDRAELQLERLQTQWTLIAQEVPQPLTARYNAALQGFHDAKHHAKEETTQREHTRLTQLRQLKDDICRSLEGLQQDLQQRHTLNEADEAAISGILRTAQNGWRNTAEIPHVEEETRFQQRFEATWQQIEQQRIRLRSAERTATELHALKQQASALADAKPTAHTSKRLQELEQHLNELDQTAEGEANETRELIHALKSKSEQALHALEKTQKTLTQYAKELETALENGKIAAAQHPLRKARRLLKQIPNDAMPRFESARKRILHAEAKFNELRDWQGWANKPEKERLCEEMEALVGAEQDPREIAQAIREAHDAWKRLGPSDPAVAEQLWERFRSAADKAYEPCAAFFAAQAAERARNLEARQAWCAEMEHYFGAIDWNQVNWKDVFKFEAHAQKHWREFGPVDRKAYGAIQERYVAALTALQTVTRAERDRNQAQKQALVTEIQTLASATDLRAAIQQAKLAQQHWKTIGAGHRKTDQTLWQEFRAACDALFSRVRENIETEQKDRQENAAKKMALCETVENLAQLSPEAIGQAVNQVKQAESTWREIGMVPKEQAKELADRFRNATQHFFTQLKKARGEKERRALAEVMRKASLCATWEQQLLDGQLTADSLASDTQWPSDIVLPSPIANALEQRRQRLNTALTDAAALTALRQQLAEHNQALPTECLRLEILADIPSPPEYAEARMAYQVSRLSTEMGQGGEASEQQTKLIHAVFRYYTVGPVDTAVKTACDARVQRIRDAKHL